MVEIGLLPWKVKLTLLLLAPTLVLLLHFRPLVLWVTPRKSVHSRVLGLVVQASLFEIFLHFYSLKTLTWSPCSARSAMLKTYADKGLLPLGLALIPSP